MSVHQCPDCPLRYATKTELEFHLREEHPGFRHDYPVRHALPARGVGGRSGPAAQPVERPAAP
jgi:hypothetical protein